MKFNEVLANQEAKEELQSMVLRDEIPHALLLTGMEGTGKLQLALALANLIMCESPENGDSCGVCKACIKASHHVHPDIHFSFPFPGSTNVSDDFMESFRTFLTKHPYEGISEWLHLLDSENKAVNINTKECRAILHKLSLQPFESPSKILIIWLPEYLRKDGNRLLKFIEEPTDNTYIVMVSDKPEYILPTIISRCRLVRVKPLQDEELSDILVNHYKLPLENAEEIAYLSEGNLRKAIHFKNAEIENYNSEVVNWFRICYALNATETIDWVENFAKYNKDEQKAFLQYTLNFLREVARVPILDENTIRLKEKELESAKKIARIVTFEEIEKLSNIISEKIYHIERNANIRTLMMDACILFKNILRQANASN